MAAAPPRRPSARRAMTPAVLVGTMTATGASGSPPFARPTAAASASNAAAPWAVVGDADRHGTDRTEGVSTVRVGRTVRRVRAACGGAGARSSVTACSRPSGSRNRALPATSTLAPAGRRAGDGVRRRCRRRPRRRRVGEPGGGRASGAPRRSSAPSWRGSAWPPKPGLTVITSTRSTRSSTWATALAGVAGLSATPARGAELADHAERAVEVRARLGVDDQPPAPGLDVARRHHLGREHHQVGLERHGDEVAGGGDDVGAERQVGHELAVHDVPLDEVDAGLLQRGDLLAEAGEVGREHGRGDLDRSGHRHRPYRRTRTRRHVRAASAAWQRPLTACVAGDA